MSELQEHIALLRRYNAWRRGKVDCDMEHPKEVGQAIDAVLNAMETEKARIDKLDTTELKLENGSQLWQVFTDASDPEMTLREAIDAWGADE